MWVTPRSFLLGTSLAPAAGGIKSQTLRKVGHNSRHTLPLHTGSTRKYKVDLQHPQDIMQQTPMWVKHNIKLLSPPLELWPTWQLPQQLNVE
jgi:hypothetical protein